MSLNAELKHAEQKLINVLHTEQKRPAYNISKYFPYLFFIHVFFTDNRPWHFMHFLRRQKNLHQMSKLIFLEKKNKKENVVGVSSAELAR